MIAATKAQGGYAEKGRKSDDKSHVYWAKGTGFGTGSTAQSWDVELAMQKKKSEEENVTCLLQVLSSFIYPRVIQSDQVSQMDSEEDQIHETDLPSEVKTLLQHSCLLPCVAGYLRNDSGTEYQKTLYFTLSSKHDIPFSFWFQILSSGYVETCAAVQICAPVPEISRSLSTAPYASSALGEAKMGGVHG